MSDSAPNDHSQAVDLSEPVQKPRARTKKPEADGFSRVIPAAASLMKVHFVIGERWMGLRRELNGSGQPFSISAQLSPIARASRISNLSCFDRAGPST